MKVPPARVPMSGAGLGAAWAALCRTLYEVLALLVLAVYYVLEACVKTLLPNSWISKSVVGDVVLVTGAAGGLGRFLVLKFVSLGARVVVWDIDQQGVEETVRQAVLAGDTGARGYTVDLADREQVYQAAERVKAEVGPVNILVNNAGVVFGKRLLQLPDHQIETTFRVNILSHYWTTKTFLGPMLRANRGHIVTVGSVAGLVGTYACVDYSASKFATVGFHESLFTELKVHGFDGVHTTLVCPYFINTGMFAGVKPRLMPMLEPSQVAQDIVDAVLTNQVTVTLPRCVRYLMPLKGLLPAKLSWALMYRVMQGPQAMMGFKGRTAE